jgi:hypothetical protein
MQDKIHWASLETAAGLASDVTIQRKEPVLGKRTHYLHFPAISHG